jgi:hypothetical protein
MKNEKLKKIKEVLEKTTEGERIISRLEELDKQLEEIKKIEKKKTEPKEVFIQNQIKPKDKIEVTNFPKAEKIEFPKEIRVSNIDGIKIPEYPKYPKEMSVKKPAWYKEVKIKPHIEKIVSAIRDTILKADILNRKPDEAISVRLVDKDGKKFIDGLSANIQGPWGSGGGSPAISKDDLNIDTEKDLQVDVKTIPTVTAKQDTLYELIETLQELNQRLAPLGSAMNAGAPALRVAGVSMPSTAVTGPQTSTQFIAAFLTSKIALENMNAVHSNINNVAIT